MLTYLLAEQAVEAAGRKYTRTEYFFPANQLPDNYHTVRVHLILESSLCMQRQTS